MRAALLSLALALPLPFLPSSGDATVQDPSGRQEPRRDPGQDPAEDPAPEKRPGPGEAPEDEARDIFGRPVKKKTKETVAERILGCWLLVDIQLNGLPDVGRQGSGILLIHEGNLALELHMTWPRGGSGSDFHQSFIADYELAFDSVLRVNTLIGSFLDEDSGQLEWERSGFAREYELTVTDRNLVLAFGAGNRMSFVRRVPATAKKRDVFGREVHEETTSRDIYGRPRKRAEGEAAPPRGTGGEGSPAPGGGPTGGSGGLD